MPAMAPPLRLATWNINSVRMRIEMVDRLIDEVAPDILCLQETKCPDELFPAQRLADLGYPHQALAGMKAYNGVAILSRHPFRQVTRQTFCGREDCRHVAVTLQGGVELHNAYVPAGGDVPDREVNEKFGHKLDFLTEMTDWFARTRAAETPMILVGDLNIAPLESDVWSHKQLLGVVSHTPIEVEHLARLRDGLGWTDAVRHLTGEAAKLYSWWSYRARDWAASDRGRRLDHIWVTAPLVPAIRKAEILRDIRGWPPKPSDHVPVVVELDLPA